MSIKRGDVVLVDLDPLKETERKKTRPCVVIQNNTGNKYSPNTIVATFTSSYEKIYRHEVELSSDVAGLDKDSKAQLDQIYTINADQITETIGKVPQEKMEKIDEALKISLGLV